MVSLLRGINIEVAIVLLQNSEDRYSVIIRRPSLSFYCLLYTSDAADDMQCVDLGGRRIIKKIFFFQAEDGIRDTDRSRGLGDVYKRQI